MKKYITAGIFFLITYIVTSITSQSHSMLIIVLATFLGYTIARIGSLQKELQQLREMLSGNRQEKNKQIPSPSVADNAIKPDFQGSDYYSDKPTQSTPIVEAKTKRATDTDVDFKPDSSPSHTPAHTEQTSAANTGSPAPRTQAPRVPGLSDKVFSYLKDFLTGGNLFVKIGILILFFGVSFLLKHMSDSGMFPIQYRLIAVVIGAIALLLFGWRIRDKKAKYALLLQGAGIGVLYLVIFAAFNMYNLLPSLPTFVLLFIVSMLSAALAVLQDSRALAIIGFSGGFLAPVLASSGSGNHVGLFSYYAILNVALVAVAWFKAWRPLNLLGFAFTFIIGSVWGAFNYQAENFSTTEPFLLLFFLFYVLIAVLFALRQPPKLRGYVDGTLLFGVPLAASALQYLLVKDIEYGVALSVLGFGVFYISLAIFLWKKSGNGLRLLSEAFLALGVIFTSLAIPFAISPAYTAAAWGLEGLGFIWLGTRQNRISMRLFGLLLQLGAAVIVLWSTNYEQQIAFINGDFISALMLAVAGILSARLLYKEYQGKHRWETKLSPVLLIWGLLWLIVGFINQVYEHYPDRYLNHAVLGFASILSIIFTFAALRTKPVWQHAWTVAIALLPFMLMALIFDIPSDLSTAYGWLVWPFAFSAFYWLLRQLDDSETKIKITPWLHTAVLLLAVLFIVIEANWVIAIKLQLSIGWQIIGWAIPAVIALIIVSKSKRWPFGQHADAYQKNAAGILAGALVLWSIGAIISRGDAYPIPWVPVLNPVDIMFGIVLITLISWWRRSDKIFKTLNIPSRNVQAGLAGLFFIWLNFSVFRISHHWFKVSYDYNSMFDSALTQTSISILWALIGVIITVFASRKNLRPIWIIGGILLALVVLKLFLVDLSELGGIGRIVSFLIVGGLLTSIGYFAPLPGDENDEADKNRD
ncbi:MAG: DUF2339 domain-containing protein [Xanthomonadales bacterium]|nr:DUF2339 domain-containing protein [Xanthomonadales bacterium]